MTNIGVKEENEIVKYLVECVTEGQTWWLADLDGDPGRTVMIANAKEFDSLEDASAAIDLAVLQNPHRKSCESLQIFAKLKLEI